MSFVYILRCATGDLYVGMTEDLASRVLAHNAGTACRFTASRRPVDLVYSEPLSSLKSAMARERQIKRWTRAKKEALISQNLDALHSLSRRRVR